MVQALLRLGAEVGTSEVDSVSLFGTCRKHKSQDNSGCFAAFVRGFKRNKKVHFSYQWECQIICIRCRKDDQRAGSEVHSTSFAW